MQASRLWTVNILYQPTNTLIHYVYKVIYALYSSYGCLALFKDCRMDPSLENLYPKSSPPHIPHLRNNRSHFALFWPFVLHTSWVFLVLVRYFSFSSGIGAPETEPYMRIYGKVQHVCAKLTLSVAQNT